MGQITEGRNVKAQYEYLKRLEAEKIARKQAEFARRDRCRSHGPDTSGGCNGHGRGLYTSSCNDEWWCDTNHENVKFNATCVCRCNEGWVGEHCQTRFTWGHCRSVGDPHPNTADGVYYNIYDAGEFIYYQHPESRSEVHALLRMAHPRISATSAVAVRVCEKALKMGRVNVENVISFHSKPQIVDTAVTKFLSKKMENVKVKTFGIGAEEAIEQKTPE